MAGPARILVDVSIRGRITLRDGTIDVHGKKLRRKLADDARAPRLVLTIDGRGCAFAEDQR